MYRNNRPDAPKIVMPTAGQWHAIGIFRATNPADNFKTEFAVEKEKFAPRFAKFGAEVPEESKAQQASASWLDIGWLYTLAELNWFHWTQGGDRGLPPSLGEGDGLINLGTSGVAGNDLVTSAVGLKAIVNRHLDVGTAFEFPLSNRKDLIDSRLLVEMIFRY